MTEDHREFTRQDGITLKEYVDTRFKAMDQASTLSHAALDHRLEAMNEARAAMRDLTATYITKVEHQALCDLFDRQEARIRDLELSRAELAGKASQFSVMVGYILSVVALIVAIVLHFL